MVKSPSDIAYIRHAGRVLARVFAGVESLVEPGITGIELDHYCEKMILSMGGAPAFKGYKGYPAAVCVSVNNVITHGVPNGIALQAGDLVSLDIGVSYEGYFADAARTFAVGNIVEDDATLLKVTEAALFCAIEKAIPNNRVSDISWAIESYAIRHGFAVVKQFGGHGIGRMLHEKPFIFNFGPPGRGDLLRSGMVLAIEPMLTPIYTGVTIGADGWTAHNKSRAVTAHFEDTILITDNGPAVLTRPELDPLA